MLLQQHPDTTLFYLNKVFYQSKGVRNKVEHFTPTKCSKINWGTKIHLHNDWFEGGEKYFDLEQKVYRRAINYLPLNAIGIKCSSSYL